VSCTTKWKFCSMGCSCLQGTFDTCEMAQKYSRIFYIRQTASSWLQLHPLCTAPQQIRKRKRWIQPWSCKTTL